MANGTEREEGEEKRKEKVEGTEVLVGELIREMNTSGNTKDSARRWGWLGIKQVWEWVINMEFTNGDDIIGAKRRIKRKNCCLKEGGVMIWHAEEN